MKNLTHKINLKSVIDNSFVVLTIQNTEFEVLGFTLVTLVMIEIRLKISRNIE